MKTSSFDAAAYKMQQRAHWENSSPGWDAWTEVFERGGASVTARLLELGRVRKGQAVLDVATGQGEPALSAAGLVGPTGRVLGVDASPAMLSVARRRAGDLPQAEFAEADLDAIDQPEASFDVVLSRFGLMFAVDPVHTLNRLAAALRPGGVLVAAVWGPASSSLVATGPGVLAQRLALPAPEPGTPGPFSLSDPDRLAGHLAEAGFVEVSIAEHTVPFWFDTIDQYVRYNRDMLPPGLVEKADEQPGAWDALVAAVRPYEEADGTLPLPSLALCVRAVKPAGGHAH
ncbi:class I SAM-dependent methyltransferase [Flindersiella endophytica]